MPPLELPDINEKSLRSGVMFEPGDKVLCKNPELYNCIDGNTEYTIIARTTGNDGLERIQLQDIKGWFFQDRFQLKEEKTASKNDKDKVDLSLIPAVSMREHAKAFMVGEKKYGRYNYTKGHKASQLVAAAMRHLTAWFEREEHDPTDGQHHLGSVMACCSMILRQQELGTLQDDRYENK
jgi:Domain of unknown function (DUF5664)